MIKNSGEIRAEELLKRAEEVAKYGKEDTTMSYEILIEHEKSKTQWRKIKFYLNKGDTEPLDRLLVKEQGTPKVLVNGEEMQTMIIENKKKLFLAVEKTPLEKVTYLPDIIGTHGALDLCDCVLNGALGETNKEAINFVEAYALLQHMRRKKQHTHPRSP